jgi:hypothetical protein
MSSNSFGEGRTPSIITMSTMFRLLILGVLLSGGLVFQSSSQCLVLAQGGKENEKNKQDKEDNKKQKDESEFPSEQPSRNPTRSPSRFPTRRPTQNPSNDPTLPTSSPSRTAFEARLPEIKIDITTVVHDIFSFASLLLDGDANGMSDTNDSNNREGLNAYFESFVVDLLIASEVVTSSSLDSVDVEIKILPLDDEDDDQGAVSSSSSSTVVSNGTPVRIAIEGNMFYYFEADEGEISDNIDMNVVLLEDKMSHTLAVYFSFWSTDEMLSRLSEYGLTDPQITAVRVDDKLILVAGDTNSDNTNEDGSGGNNDNLLVAPTDIADGIEKSDSSLMAESGGATIRRTCAFFTLAAIAGSTMVVLV